jgi:hypothetical protein
MQLHEYVSQVQRQLSEAAALGDEQVQRVAAGLASAAAPAVRLAIMTALAEAADEITALLLDVPTSPRVSVRLDGDTVRTEVHAGAAEPERPETEDAEQTARISLRLSDALKTRVEAAAASEQVSVNTWLVRAASSALSGRPVGGARTNSGHRVTGYING